MNWLALLLAGALLALPWGVRGRWRWGRNRLSRIAGRLLVLFGGGALAGLAALGRTEALWTFLPEFAAAQRWTAEWAGMPTPVRLDLRWLITAMTAGGVIAGLIARWRQRPTVTLGNVGKLMPRGWSELGWGALLSVDAGLCEEAYFRLAVPLAMALAGGGAAAGFALSAVLFGWAHRYQGVVGMAATFAVAWLLNAAYLLTGQLWVTMVLHVALDLNGLVVRPVVAGFASRSPP